MTLPDTAGSASMSPQDGQKGEGRVSRPLIVAVVVVSVLWTVVGALIQARSLWLFAVLRLGPLLVASAALVAFAVVAHAKPRPGFVVREGAGFVVPPSRAFSYLIVSEVLILPFLTGQVIDIWAWSFGGGTAEALVFGIGAVVSSVVWLVFLGLVVLLVVTALRGGPRILLTPDALVLHDVWGTRTIAWDALRPGRPLGRARRRTLSLTVDRPELVVRQGAFWSSTRRPWLVLQHLRVHPWFLADAIRFYVDHPASRDAIGTRAEYERLLPELGVPLREQAG